VVVLGWVCLGVWVFGWLGGWVVVDIVDIADIVDIVDMFSEKKTQTGCYQAVQLPRESQTMSLGESPDPSCRVLNHSASPLAKTASPAESGEVSAGKSQEVCESK